MIFISKKTIVLILFFSSFIFGQNFKFIAMSDSRGADEGVNDSVLTAFINHILTEQNDVKFLVVAGDLVSGTNNNPDETYAQLMHWKDVMHPIYDNENMVSPKIWPVIGNHEARHPKDENNFRKAFPYIPQNGPDDEKGLTYSFDFQNTHFTFVTTDRWFYGDTNTYSDDRRDWHYIKHLDWLENDFDQAKQRGVDHIIFVSHEMIYPTGGHLHDGLPNLGKNFQLPVNSTQKWYMDKRQRVIDLIKKYNVDVHVCGHEHLYARQNVNGVFEIIAGSAGAHLYSPNPVYRSDSNTVYPGEQMSYSAAVPYYKALNYNYGPGKNSQASENYVGKRAFNYVLFDVQKDTIFVKTYGGYPSESNTTELGSDIHLLDQFEIVKSITNVKEKKIPKDFILLQNYPNPFNPSTVISFSIPEASNVELSVYNILGQKIATILNKQLTAGSYKYNFNGSNLTSGIYFYKFQAASYFEIRKMMLFK